MTPEYANEVLQRARCLATETEVEAIIDKLAQRISDKLKNNNPILMCVMNGGLVFAGKLATRLNFPLQIDYLQVSRYRDNTSGGELKWHREPSLDLHGRHVLLVDDILDEGATLDSIVRYCEDKGARDVSVTVLIEKLHQRKLSPLQAEFTGLKLEDSYLVGYGMDYQGYWRNAPGIYAIAAQDCDQT